MNYNIQLTFYQENNKLESKINQNGLINHNLYAKATSSKNKSQKHINSNINEGSGR